MTTAARKRKQGFSDEDLVRLVALIKDADMSS